MYMIMKREYGLFFFALEVQLPWSLFKRREKGHNVFMKYILCSLSNTCDK